jgi:hypothetical protein
MVLPVYEEEKQNMSISKCIHGVYDPSGTGTSFYCSGCTPQNEIKPNGEDLGKLALEWEDRLNQNSLK